MRKLLFILILLTVFSSCSLFISDNESKNVVSKTTIEDIVNCNNPIVITMPVYDNQNLFGNKKLKNKQKRLGDIFVVIDTKTNSVFDWVFCENPTGSTIWRCIELGINPTKYFSSCETLQCCIQEGKTTVQKFPTACTGNYMENLGSLGTKGLIIGNGYDSNQNEETYIINVFDSETGYVSSDLSFYTDWIGYIKNPISDDGNKFYVINGLNYSLSIECIDTEKESITQLPIEINPVEIREDKEELYNYYILDVNDDKILITKYLLGKKSKKTSLNLVYLKDNDIQNSMKSIICPEKFYSNDESAYFARGFHYNNEFYAILIKGEIGNKSIAIIKPDFSELTVENISGFINFEMTENIWVKDSKVYFMNSRKLKDVYFLYYDLETNQASEVFNLKYDEIISSTHR